MALPAAAGLLAIAIVALWPTPPAHAASTTETFGNWTTAADEVDTGEDQRKTCTATVSFTDSAGKGGMLALAISNGDVLPPEAYPAVTITAGDPSLPGGENIAAIFSDDNGKVEATFYANDAADGQRQWLMNNQNAATLALLRAMRRATALDVQLGGRPVANVSMSGFTKAYRWLGSSCGFPTDDIER